MSNSSSPGLTRTTPASATKRPATAASTPSKPQVGQSNDDSALSRRPVRPSAAPSPAPLAPLASSSVPSYPPYPAQFESELTSPIPSDPALSFDPVAFFAVNFPSVPSSLPSTSSSALYSVQVQRSVSQLSSAFAVKEDRTTDHTTTRKAIESTIETLLSVTSGATSLDELTSSSEDHEQIAAIRRHLVSATRSLRTLHVLISSCDALRQLVIQDPHGYTHILRLIQSIYELFPLLRSYQSLPIIQSLKSSLINTKLQIRRIVFLDFYFYLPELHITTDLIRLNSALRLLDFFPTGARDRSVLIDWWCSIKLTPFTALLKSQRTWKDIMKISDMYTWIYKFLQTYENVGYNKVFPPHWAVDGHFARKWMDIAAQHVSAILNSLGERIDLFKPLKASVELELCLANRIKRVPPPQQNIMGIKPAVTNSNSVPANVEGAAAAPAAASSALPTSESVNNLAQSLADSERIYDYAGNLSSCFEPFLNIFIELEQASLEAYVAGLDGTEIWTPADEEKRKEELGPASTSDSASPGDDPVSASPVAGKPLLNSAGEMDPRQYYPTLDLLFNKINKSLTRYSKLIHNETLFGLSKEYRRAVCDYIKKCEGHLPKLSSNPSATAANSAILSSLDTNDLILVVRLCTTGEECVKRCDPLAEEVQKQLDAQFREYVDFTAVNESVRALENRAMGVLVAYLAQRLETHLPSLIKESKKEIGALPEGAESSVVKAIFNMLKREIPRFNHLNGYPMFLNQFVSKFVPVYLAALKKQKGVDESWAGLLLADTKIFKNLMIKLADPEYVKVLYLENSAVSEKERAAAAAAAKKKGKKEEKSEADGAQNGKAEENGDATSPAPANAYEELISNEVGKIERFLLVLASKSDSMITTFRKVFPKGTPQMLAELFDLRGISSSDQKSLVKAHNQGLHVSKHIPLDAFNKSFVSSFMGDLKKQIEKM